MNKRVNLREGGSQSVESIGSPTLTPDSNIVENVKLCGVQSKNGRTYPLEVLKRREGLYLGSKINLNHDFDNPSRRLEERFGRVIAVESREDGLYGSLKYNPHHPYAETFKWFVENDPSSIGLSHNAIADVEELDDGTLIVKDILEVLSVDIVSDPATTNGLFESMNDNLNLTPDIKKEDDLTSEPAMGDEGYASHIGNAVVSIIKDESLSSDDKKKKILGLLKLLDEETPDETPTPESDEEKKDDEVKEADGDEKDDKKEETKESLKKTVSKLKERLDAYELRESINLKTVKAKKFCSDHHLPAATITSVLLEHLINIPESKWKKVIEDRKSVIGVKNTPKSVGQGGTEASFKDFLDVIHS